jgi:hypothetical protein
VAVLQKPLEEAVLLEAIERALGRGPLEGKGSVGS